MENKIKIAVIKADGIGDAALASSFFLGLRKHFKDAQITAYLSPGGAQVLSELKCFDEVKVFNAQWLKYKSQPFFIRWLSALMLLGKINKGKYDIVIGMRWQDRLTSLILSLSNAKQKYGYDTGGMGFSITNIVKQPPMAMHVAAKNMLMLKTITNEKYPEKPFLKTDIASEENISALLKKGNITKYIIIHPVSGHLSKDWGIENYNALAEYLSRGIKVIVIGDKNDKSVNALRGRHVVNLVGMLTVKELKAIIKHAALVIGNDSAAVHIAAAFGVKTLTLFSGTARHQEWGAYGDKSYIIEKYTRCSPCGLVKCNMKRECLDIPVDFVANKALQIMKGKQEQKLIKYKIKENENIEGINNYK
ncbi:MAG: glycosyltransferase family 9 protein [bacterium]